MITVNVVKRVGVTVRYNHVSVAVVRKRVVVMQRVFVRIVVRIAANLSDARCLFF